jgi:hypothetical protein
MSMTTIGIRSMGSGAGRGRRLVVLTVVCVALAAVVGMLVSLVVALPDLAGDLGATEAQL